MSRSFAFPSAQTRTSLVSGLALGAVSGILLFLLFPPFGFTWLAPLALMPLILAAAAESSWRRRFLIGEVAGVIFWAGTCNWIHFVLTEHGGLPWLGGWGVFALFCLAKALHWGVFTALAGFLLPRWWAVPALAALWTGIERTHPIDFTWLLLGNAASEMEIPLRMAPWTGVYGVSFVLALISATIAIAVLRQPRIRLLWLVAFPALYLLPALPGPEAATNTALAEQTNFDVNDAVMDYEPVAVQTLAATMTVGKKPLDLIVWPESPAPLYFYRDAHFREEILSIAQRAHAPFLLSTVAFTPAGAPLNSAVMVSAAGEEVSRYDKVNLVPFGEFVPPMFGFVGRITDAVSDFVPGERQVVSVTNGHRFGAFICYESAFPEFVAGFTRGGAEVLVNLTNDGYFGHLAARDQHLLLARMRAVENHRWLLRVTNNGYTAAIDPAGRVVQQLPGFKRLSAKLGFNFHQEMTFYAAHGDWFAWGCLLAGATLSALAAAHSNTF